MPALVIWGLGFGPKTPQCIAGITARPALAKALCSHYVQAKSSLDNPSPTAAGTKVMSL